MKKNVISEVNRVLEIMGLEILSEQRTIEKVIDIKKFDVQVPVPPIKGKYSAGQSDPAAFLQESVNTIIQAINDVPGASTKLEEGKLRLVEISVKAGASNYWPKHGATQFDHLMAGEGGYLQYVPKENVLSYEGKEDWDTLSKEGYTLNLNLAKLRASTYIDEITPLLDGIEGLSISDELSKVPEAMVVNTGGKNDDSNCTECGQVLILTLSFVYTDIKEFTETTCLPEIQISISVKGYGVDGHQCDEAVFKVTVNGVEIGVANLNNAQYDILSGAKWHDKYHMAAIKKVNAIESDKRYSDGKLGGERSWTTMIDTTNPDLNWGENNVLSIKSLVVTKNGTSTIKGYGGMSMVCSERGGYGRGAQGKGVCGVHVEVPFVTIKNTPEVEGQLETVYDAQPNIALAGTRGSMKTTELLTLDNCGVPIQTTVSTEG